MPCQGSQKSNYSRAIPVLGSIQNGTETVLRDVESYTRKLDVRQCGAFRVCVGIASYEKIEYT